MEAYRRDRYESSQLMTESWLAFLELKEEQYQLKNSLEFSLISGGEGYAHVQ